MIFSKKLVEMTQIKHSSAKKNWSEAAEKNFHKSLDHRSFYFKKQEKKLTAQNRFINEAEFRYKVVMGNPSAEVTENASKEVYFIIFYQNSIISLNSLKIVLKIYRTWRKTLKNILKFLIVLMGLLWDTSVDTLRMLMLLILRICKFFAKFADF